MIRPCSSCGGKNRIPPSRFGEPARCGRCKAPLLPVDAPMTIESAADFDALLASSKVPVLVDFWAEWCAPCRMVAPELARLAKDRAGGVLVVEVDTERLPDLAGRYRIEGIPAFMLFRGGKLDRRATGAMRAEQLASALGL